MTAIISDPIVANTNQQDEKIQNFRLSESQMHRFGDVLQTMSLEAMPIFASNVRRLGHHDTGIVSPETLCKSDSVPCKITGPPLCGSFNIVFTLEFDDGVKWMLKISANGHRFDSVAAAALISEARTMQLLKSETTIPIPAVYAFDASSCNDLNVPFILMERIDGKPLFQGWFDDEIPKPRLEHFRVKVLQSLAEAMAQLNKFTLNRGGALEFDPTGSPVGLRGAKVVDAVAMYNQGMRVEEESKAVQDDANSYENYDGNGDCHDNDETQGLDNKYEVDDKEEKSDKDDKNDQDIICEKGPFECPKSAFLFNLDRSDACRPGDEYTHGCNKALRMFLDLAFSNSDNHGRHFILTHPDLDVQNVLVAEDGTLRGLIDWDGVACVPREVGCAQYPLWIMRDWVPYYYLYDIQEGKTEEDAGYEESPPAELASYRALYAHFMEKEIERQTGGADRVTTFGTLPKQEAQLTRRSLVMRDLDLAASSPFLTTNILCHIVNQIEQVTEPEWGRMDLDTDSDSSCSSEDGVGSDSAIPSDTNNDHEEEEDLETEATTTGDDGTRCMADAASSNQFDEGAATLGRVLPQTMAKFTDSSLGVPQHDHGSHTSSKACQKEAEELKAMYLSNMHFKADSSMKLAPLGWGRRLLCFGCTAAEKGLRRIAKVGHVLEDTIDHVAEVLAEVEVQSHTNSQRPSEGETGQTTDSLIHQQSNEVEAFDTIEAEQHGDNHSAQGMAEPEQLHDIPSVHGPVEMQGAFSIQDTIEPDQFGGAASIQPPMELQDIPARKAELFKAGNVEMKAHHRADKAKMKEELKVWENIALTVWARGVSLEQLQLNQGKIARWVVDTLQPEEKQMYDLQQDPYLQPEGETTKHCTMQATEEPEAYRLEADVLKTAKVEDGVQPRACKVDVASIPNVSVPIFEEEQNELESSTAILSTPQPQTGLCPTRNPNDLKQDGVRKGMNDLIAARGARMLPGSGKTNNWSLELLDDTTLTNNRVSVSQKMQSEGAESDGESGLERHSMNLDAETVGIAAKLMSTPSTRSSSTPKDHLRPEKASGSLKALCSFGTSCLKKIFWNHNKSADDEGNPTPDSSVNGSHDGDSDRSDTDQSCKSSATSLSDNEVRFGENGKAEEAENDVFGTVVIPVTEYHDGKHDRHGDTHVWEDLATKEAMEKKSSRDTPTFASGLGKRNGSDKPCLPRRIHDSYNGQRVESKKSTTLPKTGQTAKATSGEIVAGTKPTEHYEDGLDAKSEKDAEDGGEDIYEGDSSSDEGGDEEGMSAFRDDGEFRSRNIFSLLGMDMLDELRLLRLQEGFLKLLELY